MSRRQARVMLGVKLVCVREREREKKTNRRWLGERAMRQRKSVRQWIKCGNFGTPMASTSDHIQQKEIFAASDSSPS